MRQLGVHVYPCGCSRREIADSQTRLTGRQAQTLVYPGTCRHDIGSKPARAWRVDTRGARIAFETGQESAETLAPRYADWDRFQRVRAMLDPQGCFRNAYTDRVLGPIA